MAREDRQVEGVRTRSEREDLRRLRALWLQPEFQEGVDREFPYADMAGAIIALRAQLGITQAELAARCGTTQSVIARLESGRHPVQTTLLRRIATSLGLRWRPVFEQPAVTDVFDGLEGEDKATPAELVDFAARRRARGHVADWQLAEVETRDPKSADFPFTWPELREALDRFVGSFAASEERSVDEHQIAEAESEYTAV
jgi:transcriptional regulator with XRE-family HTH domain